MISPVVFFKEARSELNRVSWPTRQQTLRLTLIVVAISIVVAFFIGGLDLLFTKLTSVILPR